MRIKIKCPKCNKETTTNTVYDRVICCNCRFEMEVVKMETYTQNKFFPGYLIQAEWDYLIKLGYKLVSWDLIAGNVEVECTPNDHYYNIVIK